MGSTYEEEGGGQYTWIGFEAESCGLLFLCPVKL